MSNNKSTFGDDVEGLQSTRTHSTISDRLYMPVSRSVWKHCTVYTTVQQKEFRMYYSDPNNPDVEEDFVLSAKIFDNSNVLISTKESFPKDYQSIPSKLVPKNSVQLMDFDDNDEEKRDDSSGGSFVAKIERQLDNSFLICLSTCRYCDYEYGHFSCGCTNSYGSYGLQGNTREVCARVKHVSNN